MSTSATLQSFLAAYLFGEVDTLPYLADWLEDHSDPRFVKVRELIHWHEVAKSLTTNNQDTIIHEERKSLLMSDAQLWACLCVRYMPVRNSRTVFQLLLDPRSVTGLITSELLWCGLIDKETHKPADAAADAAAAADTAYAYAAANAAAAAYAAAAAADAANAAAYATNATYAAANAAYATNAAAAAANAYAANAAAADAAYAAYAAAAANAAAADTAANAAYAAVREKARAWACSLTNKIQSWRNLNQSPDSSKTVSPA